MKYVVWVSLGGECIGEYSRIKHKTLWEAKREMIKALAEPRIIDAWISEEEGE